MMHTVFLHAASATTTAPPGPPPLFPVGDWQFWIVTTIALVAVVWLAGKMLPKRLFSAHRRNSKPATLTVAGKPLHRAASRRSCH